MSLVNICSDAVWYDDADRIREFVKEVKVDKLPGYSSVESDGDSSKFQKMGNRCLNSEVHEKLKGKRKRGAWRTVRANEG
jgi:hypothetical protein